MKLRALISWVILVPVISACAGNTSTNSAPVTNSASQSTELPPTPYPDTPSPPEINAALIEAPVLVKIQFLNELDGWGVTETEIARTNDGGITWYDVSPPDMTETGYSIGIYVLDNDHVWVQKPDFKNFPSSGFLSRT